MSNSELFQALNMFKSGVQDLNTQRVIAQANEAVAQVKASVTNEQEQRSQLQNISNQLVATMAGMGVPATTMAAAAQAIGPKQFANGDAMLTEAALTGSSYLRQGGLQANKDTQADERAKAAQAFEYAKALKEMDIEASGARQQAKMQRMRPLQNAEIQRITAQEDSFGIAQDILARVQANPDLVGILAGRVPARGQLEPEFAAFKADLGRFFDKYRVSTTGAGASEKEILMLMTRMAQETDTPATFGAKMESYLKEVNGSRKRYLSNLRRANANVEQFNEDMLASPAGSTAPAAPAGKPGAPAAPQGMREVTVKGPDGRLIKAFKDANGNYYAAE